MPVRTESRFPAARVRKDFLGFFAERGHAVVPSGPVFPMDDPTLLFTNAGMNQFKDVFLGTGKRPYTRAADTQKCIRVSGKHNDLEEVGVDTYHHTFFEMLGNWSFGDYFKEDAIRWAWELFTKVWKLPEDRLWVTVFGGDEKDGLPADVDAARLWAEAAGVDPARILRFGRKDNFWEMGDTGPCGPCTEIHIDRGAPGTDPRDGADRARGVNAGNERFMELWNLVFIQFNRVEGGALKELPARHVDTGMGFERITAVLQGKRSNYDTDLFAPIFAELARATGKSYGSSESVDIAFRVSADHVRAVTAAVSDGALPSNTGRGYVLRRLVRRAARYGRQSLGVEEPFLFRLVAPVAEILGQAFPEMAERADHVALVLQSEEEAFARTLGRGLVRFEELASRTSRAGASAIGGAEAFELYATYGFPRDLVELMAREHGLAVDAEGWEQSARTHQEASRSEGKFKPAQSFEGLAPTRSTYHEPDRRSAAVETRILRADPGREGEIDVVLEETPFYAESGGQIGDTGRIEAKDGSFALEVRDTQRIGGVVVHRSAAVGGGRITGGSRTTAAPDLAGRGVLASVDAARRDLTRKNHTATHLLHKALKEILGAHVAQQGSYVGPDRLRFDFAHAKGVTPEELERIEALVNERIGANDAVVTTVEELEKAKARGAVAMFGEKYESKVRVLDVGGWSTELCGGTHVRAAGDIGPFVILSERAIAAGVRRIEAVTGPAAVAEIQRQRRLLREAAQTLKAAPEDVPQRIGALQASLKEAKKKAEGSAAADLSKSLAEARASLSDAGGVKHGVYASAELDQKAINDLLDRLKAQEKDLAVALVGQQGDKVPWVIACSGAALARGASAKDFVAPLKQELGGGGGGSQEKAQGQGTNPAGIAPAVEHLRKALAERLG